MYDPATDTWSDRSARMPVPAHHIQGVTVGGKIYFIGGISTLSGAVVGNVRIYDPVHADDGPRECDDERDEK